MNNVELIVATLQAAGVSHGFGIPGGNVLPLIEAMRVGRLRYVLTAHEGSAAFMADVMGRLTGAPGLCIATLGPGGTNLTAGVGNAYLDRYRSWRSRAICRRRSSGAASRWHRSSHALPADHEGHAGPSGGPRRLDARRGARDRPERAAGARSPRFARGRRAGVGHRGRACDSGGTAAAPRPGDFAAARGRDPAGRALQS